MKHTVTSGQWNQLFSAAQMANDKIFQSPHPVRLWRGTDPSAQPSGAGILLQGGELYPLSAGVGVHVWPVHFDTGTETTVVTVEDGV